MNKEEIKKLIDKYFAGETSLEEEKLLSQELQSNSEGGEFDDLKFLFEGFDELRTLKAETTPMLPVAPKDSIKTDSKIRQIGISPALAIAASVALVLIGFTFGMFVGPGQSSSEELAALKNEMASMKELVVLSRLQDNSASNRIMATYQVRELDSLEDNVRNALANSMSSDENLNVRLAALDALTQFSNDSDVRNVLLSQLAAEEDAIMKIKIIETLVNINEKRALPDLQRIATNEKEVDLVKERAAVGITKLI